MTFKQVVSPALISPSSFRGLDFLISCRGRVERKVRDALLWHDIHLNTIKLPLTRSNGVTRNPRDLSWVVEVWFITRLYTPKWGLFKYFSLTPEPDTHRTSHTLIITYPRLPSSTIIAPTRNHAKSTRRVVEETGRDACYGTPPARWAALSSFGASAGCVLVSPSHLPIREHPSRCAFQHMSITAGQEMNYLISTLQWTTRGFEPRLSHRQLKLKLGGSQYLFKIISWLLRDKLSSELTRICSER